MEISTLVWPTNDHHNEILPKEHTPIIDRWMQELLIFVDPFLEINRRGKEVHHSGRRDGPGKLIQFVYNFFMDRWSEQCGKRRFKIGLVGLDINIKSVNERRNEPFKRDSRPTRLLLIMPNALQYQTGTSFSHAKVWTILVNNPCAYPVNIIV